MSSDTQALELPVEAFLRFCALSVSSARIPSKAIIIS